MSKNHGDLTNKYLSHWFFVCSVLIKIGHQVQKPVCGRLCTEAMEHLSRIVPLISLTKYPVIFPNICSYDFRPNLSSSKAKLLPAPSPINTQPLQQYIFACIRTKCSSSYNFTGNKIMIVVIFYCKFLNST